MTRRVDARDVLDADATTARAFNARVLGRYRRTGPNSWDDYRLVEEDGGEIRVSAETPVQLESEGALCRMRRRGGVVVVRWLPEPGELERGQDPRARFVELCLRTEDPTPEGNLGHWLHGELTRKPEPND
jgi:hypothetical protein